MPTTLTSSYEQLLAVTENIGARYKEATGAKIRGIYFEGPYFTEKYKGAQNPSYMKDPSGWKNLAGKVTQWSVE